MKKYIVLLLLLAVIWGCQNLNPVDPPPELNFDSYGVYVDTTLYANQAEFKVDYRIDTQYATLLNLGNYKDFDAQVLLKFTSIPTSVTTIDTAYIELSSNGKLADACAQLSVDMVVPTETWDAAANLDEAWHSPIAGETIGQFTVSDQDTEKIRIYLDPALVAGWQTAGNDNNGLLLRTASGSGEIIRDME